MDFHSIERKLSELLHEIEDVLPSSDIENSRELISHAEFGVAFELVCDQLYENDITLNESTFLLLNEIGISLDIPSARWEILSLRKSP